MHANVPWLKPALWGAVLGSIVTMIVGFSWLGWVLGSTADRMARERTDAAVVSAMTPGCVARFLAEPKAAQKLGDLRQTDSWKQREFIEAGGWATIGEATTANSALATTCAEQLLKTKA
jgi:hypothetical protein